MKTMKLWRIAFVMLAAFSLASCSSDDDDYDVNNLVGTWQRVYDEGVVSEGYEEYTFSDNGNCDIHVYDVFAGDTTLHWGYMLKDNRQLIIYEPMYGGSSESQTWITWIIKKLGSSTMSWERADHADIIYNFKRAASQR
jgi:hypothetical protein